MASGDWAIDGTGLVKRFGATLAVAEADLRVRAGTVHGLLGPNGAGKTTLLRMLFGLIRPDAGTLRLFGRTRDEVGQRVLDGVAGFVEAPRFYPYLTGYRNLQLLAAFDGGVPDSTVDEVLRVAGLAGRAHDKAGRYSLGMRQRLGVAAALLRTPRLLVLDEPANGLDPAGARDMRALLREFSGSGRTVLMSSHNMSDVEALCDEVTILSRGDVAYAGTVEELRGRAPAPAYQLRTSDDVRALAHAAAGVTVSPHPAGGLAIGGDQASVDAYVLALGRAGVAVRALALEQTPLEALFLGMTGGDGMTGGGPDPGALSDDQAAPVGAAAVAR